ncbi:MAG TPA: thioredoxin domain-containing protein, partial [Nannocystis sp.]
MAAVGLSVSCRKAAPEPEVPAEGGAVASEDAARLPAFDMSDDSPAGDGVPFERFFVELGDAPVRGSSAAPVTIVAFSDFECPYCEKGHETILQVEREYGEKVRIAYKAYPLDFHSHAMIAALAARSAQDQGKFWQFHDLLFSQRGLDMPTLDAYARQAGLDMDRLHADLEALKWGPSVSRDMRQARKLGVTGTPAYFVNGRFLSGAKPIEVMRALIDQEIDLAVKWQAQGVAPDKVYEHAIAKGYREVQYAKPRKGLKPDV